MNNRLKKFLVVVDEFNFSKVSSRSAELAFYLTLSIFPSIIFFLSLTAFIPEIDKIIANLINLKLIPKDAYEIINTLLISAVENSSSTIIISSFLISTWTFSKAISSIIKGENAAFKVKENRNPFLLLIISIVIAIGFFLLMVFSIVLLVYGKKISIIISKLLDNNIVIVYFFNILRIVLPIIFMNIIFTLLFKLGPAIYLRFRDIIYGSLTTSILWIIFSVLYAYYANNFSTAKEIYGSISTVIVLMTWLYFCSFSIVIGFRINSIIYFRKKKK